MRVYHFTSERWGLESIKRRRLKLALLEDMNDPFELLGVELKTPEDRAFFQRRLKPEMNRTVGLPHALGGNSGAGVESRLL